MNDHKGMSNVETGVDAGDGPAIVAAAMERVASLQKRIDELVQRHNGPMSALDPHVDAAVRQLVEQRFEAEFGLEVAKARYVCGPVHYVVEVCDCCGALHWAPAPTHEDDDIRCMCRLCDEPTRMPETAHERMRAAHVARSSEAGTPFARYWGDRLVLDSRSLLDSVGNDQEPRIPTGNDDAPG